MGTEKDRTVENLQSEVEKLNSEIERLRAELEKGAAEILSLTERLKEHEAGMDEERRAMMFMLEDTNKATAEMESAQKGLKDEIEITTHLLMISEATAHTVDIDRLMKEVVHCSCRMLGCDVCLSYMWDIDAGEFRPDQASGLDRRLMPVFMTDQLDEKIEFVKNAMKGKKPVILSAAEDVADSPVALLHQNDISVPGTPQSAFHWLPDIKTLAAIPLIGRERPFGILIILFARKHDFEERDIKVMQGISNQVSVALEQAKLHKDSVERAMELSHKIETIQVMHEIDKSILSTLNRDEILEIATKMVAKIIPCDRATIVLADREKEGFIYASGFGVPFIQKGGFTPFSDTSATLILETGRPEYMSNLGGVEDLLPLEKQLLEAGFLSHIRVPLMVKGDIIGLLSTGSKRPSAFTVENLSTLEKMALQISVALENSRLVSDLEELFLGTVKSLSSAIDAKSKWTAGHSERVTSYALGIGQEMGLSEKVLKNLEMSGLLHDIGKIGTYEAILDKPGKLTDEELAMVKLHPARGAEILAPIKLLKDIIPAIKHHHEFYDGAGYPDGLKGEDIPLMARILAVADTFDAMKADRPYRKGRAMEFIIEEFRRCTGTQFDPQTLEAFFKLLSR